MTLERKALSKLKPYTPGKSIASVMEENGLTDVVKLASNENPLGCPVSAEELSRTISDSYLYPHPMESNLGAALALFYGVDRSQVVLGNGSDELIQMIAAAFLSPGEEMITSKHTFSVYEMVATLFDGEVTFVPMKDRSYDLNAIRLAVTEKTKVIFIANPNNPTGDLLSTAELESFIKSLPPHVVVVIDEAYGEFVTDPDYVSAIQLTKTYPSVVALRTFSKLYGLAGMRVGYAVAQSGLITSLLKVRPPFNVNSIALKAAELALGKREFVDASLKVVEEGNEQIRSALAGYPLTILPTQANFLCMELPCLADDVTQALLKDGIIIRSLRSFGLSQAIRVTIGRKEQNLKFLKSFISYLEAHGHDKDSRNT